MCSKAVRTDLVAVDPVCGFAPRPNPRPPHPEGVLVGCGSAGFALVLEQVPEACC